MQFEWASCLFYGNSRELKTECGAKQPLQGELCRIMMTENCRSHLDCEDIILPLRHLIGSQFLHESHRSDHFQCGPEKRIVTFVQHTYRL